jgi:hypothetical protein
MIPQQIEIGKKSRPVFFGWSALAEFERLSGIGLQQLDKAFENLSAANVINFVYSGLYGGAKKTQTEIDFTVDDVAGWLDDYTEPLDELMKVYIACMPLASGGQTSKKKQVARR